MKCLVALALLTAAPALAQTGCPTAADRDRGIRLDFSTGGSEVYRPAAAGVVTVNGVDNDGGGYRFELAHGAMLLVYEDVIDGAPDPSTRARYDYGLTPAQMPVPVPGGTWASDVTVTAGTEVYDEAQSMIWGKRQTVTIGDCAYQGFDVRISYDTASNYVENLMYLPDLGFGYLVWKESDGSPRDLLSVTSIRVAK